MNWAAFGPNDEFRGLYFCYSPVSSTLSLDPPLGRGLSLNFKKIQSFSSARAQNVV